MTSHPEVETLSTYLDHELADPDRRRVEVHLERCGDCRRRLQSLQHVVHRLSVLERRTPPPQVGLRLKRLSRLDTHRPTWVERLERGAARFNVETATIPIFGVIVALTIIIYLLATGIQQQGSLDPGSPAAETVGEPVSRVVGDRTFDLIGETWSERGLQAGGELERLTPDDPEVQRWLELHPEILQLTSLGSSVRMRLGGRQVEILFADLD